MDVDAASGAGDDDRDGVDSRGDQTARGGGRVLCGET